MTDILSFITFRCFYSRPQPGEAEAAESRRDFIHKMQICLKELRETSVNLRIIQGALNMIKSDVQAILNECFELIAIFVSSVKTAKSKL